MRSYVLKAKEPFARFVRAHYVAQREPLLSPETQCSGASLFPAPSPVTPEAAGLRGAPATKGGLFSRAVSLFLLLYFAASSYLALGEPRRPLSKPDGARGWDAALLSQTQKRCAEEKELDIEGFLRLGAAQPEATGKTADLFNLLEAV